MARRKLLLWLTPLLLLRQADSIRFAQTSEYAEYHERKTAKNSDLLSFLFGDNEERK